MRPRLRAPRRPTGPAAGHSERRTAIVHRFGARFPPPKTIMPGLPRFVGSCRQPTHPRPHAPGSGLPSSPVDRKSTRLNSSHLVISYAVFCLKKKKLAMLRGLSCFRAGGQDTTRVPEVAGRAPHRCAALAGASCPPRLLRLFLFFFFFKAPAPPDFSSFPLPAALPH